MHFSCNSLIGIIDDRDRIPHNVGCSGGFRGAVARSRFRFEVASIFDLKDQTGSRVYDYRAWAVVPSLAAAIPKASDR